jgi:hypothetical protein
MTSAASGARAIPPKKVPIPTSAKAAGWRCQPGSRIAMACPKAAPASAPMTSDGARSPTDIPLPVASAVATVFTASKSRRRPTSVQPDGRCGAPVRVICARP